MEFEDYFSLEAIVRDLVKWRIAGKDVGGTLPPRKTWSRAGVKERRGVDPASIRKQSILRTIFRCRESPLPPHLYKSGGSRDRVRPAEKLEDAIWGRRLLALVDEVRTAVFGGSVVFEEPKKFEIAKGRENGVTKFRTVASFERLSDRVILSRMTAYVRDGLEGVLSDRCYSFRRDSKVTHQLAVEHLQEYRARFPVGSLFVAECDIKKFFDNILHGAVRRRWDEVGFDTRAGKVLEAYLGVYAAESAETGAVLPCERRGLPQGGSFSTVLANLVLAEADDAVAKADDGRLFYARYCDDVVFVHPDEAACRRAMAAYAAALDGLDLPMHPVAPFVYRPGDGRATDYYSLKSKGPFLWREAGRGEANCAPWVSFLGSQVRYDGETRIRKESVERHICALGRETAAAVREIEGGAFGNCGVGVGGHDGAAAWFARFRNRLIAKGVGYVTAKVEDCGMCWAGAFQRVTVCDDTKKQMRHLDRVREGMLCKVWNLLMAQSDTSATSRLTRRYKGRPFSYFGFLEKAVRPTNLRAMRYGGQANMARRRRRIARLPYSEL